MLFDGPRSAQSELKADAEAFGLPLDRVLAAFGQASDQTGVWRVNTPVVEAFLKVADQWRVVPGFAAPPLWLGLDYAACEAGFRLAGIVPGPELWDALRIIEQGAKAALNGE